MHDDAANPETGGRRRVGPTPVAQAPAPVRGLSLPRPVEAQARRENLLLSSIAEPLNFSALPALVSQARLAGRSETERPAGCKQRLSFNIHQQYDQCIANDGCTAHFGDADRCLFHVFVAPFQQYK